MKHQRCPNHQMLSPAILSTNAQAEKSPFISILAWYDAKEQLRHFTLLLPRLVFFLCPCVCSSPMEEPEYSRLWGPAPWALLQHYPGRLVNTGNTNPLNTSLLCLEECHDNTQRTPEEMWCLLGGYILRYAQSLPFWSGGCHYTVTAVKVGNFKLQGQSLLRTGIHFWLVQHAKFRRNVWIKISMKSKRSNLLHGSWHRGRLIELSELLCGFFHSICSLAFRLHG